MVPTNKYLVYNKNQGTLIDQQTTLYKISLLSQSPRTWVFQKSGSGPVTGTREATQLTPSSLKKTNLQIITQIQGKVLSQGNRNKLADVLRKGTLFGASDGSVKNGKGSHAWIITPGTGGNSNNNQRIRSSGWSLRLHKLNESRESRIYLLSHEHTTHSTRV